MFQMWYASFQANYASFQANKEDYQMHYHIKSLTVRNGIYRAYYSDDTSPTISQAEATELSATYNIEIESEDDDSDQK